MLNCLSLVCLTLAALGRHAITHWSKTIRLRLALSRTSPGQRESIIKACAEFELKRMMPCAPGGSDRSKQVVAQHLQRIYRPGRILDIELLLSERERGDFGDRRVRE